MCSRYNPAKHRERIDLLDLDRQEAAGQLEGAVENDDPVAGRAAHELRCSVIRDSPISSTIAAQGCPRKLGQSPFLRLTLLGPSTRISIVRPRKRLAVFEADGVLNGQQIVVSPPLDRLGNVVVVKFCGLRAGPRAVFENEAVLKPSVAHQCGRLLKNPPRSRRKIRR